MSNKHMTAIDIGDPINLNEKGTVIGSKEHKEFALRVWAAFGYVASIALQIGREDLVRVALLTANGNNLPLEDGMIETIKTLGEMIGWEIEVKEDDEGQMVKFNITKKFEENKHRAAEKFLREKKAFEEKEAKGEVQ